MATGRTGHLERTAQEPRDKSLLTVTLIRVDQANERVRLFRLALQSGPVSVCRTPPIDNDAVQFSPGQWLDTYVPGIAKPGGFTITSPPSAAAQADPYFELAVQESPDNPPAAWLWRPAEDILGSELRVRVGGSFVFPPAGRRAAGLRRVVFVAGGVGINPLMGMMSAIADGTGGFDGDVRVLYSCKTPAGGVAQVLFLRRIARLFDQGRLRGRLQVFATDTPPESDLLRGLGNEYPEAGLEILARRFGEADLKAAFDGVEDSDSFVVYVCGPPRMTDEVVGILTSPEGVKLQPEQVLTEKWW
ncbi:hypothetical protein AK830_g3019 [Neonectria ditissima]|uniref:Oxidoreductase NAD-binding domain-containing protein 1 n=1 Tax=Neonectria ditissima TaxID=78410 RepID=A0A0P7BIW4_9HYPO|nr:hypothetical protein AK830_g3019 [Neonectria ditissima]